ncbi:MAG: ABC transporter ATP-binding protein [Propioniciclava sp.]
MTDRAAPPPSADIRHVSVSFPRRRQAAFLALDDISLQVYPGEIVCLLGPNGSGKTTLVNLLTGLLRPTAGEVAAVGADPRAERRWVLSRLALVPQETAIYPELTGRENLAFHAGYYGIPRRNIASRVTEALALVQLTDRAEDRAGTYSGGMQRRLTLARALMMRPELLILDEPTLGVDVHSREAIWDRIRATAADGGAVLLTTNYMEEADALADRVVIIDRGHVVAAGTVPELVAALPETDRVAPPPRASLQEVFLFHTGRALRD